MTSKTTIKTESNKTELAKYKPLSFDWWWEKGHQDYNTFEFSEPQHPKVKPYLDGWHSAEDSCRDSWGNQNIFIDD